MVMPGLAKQLDRTESRRVLVPFNPAETLSPKEASKITGDTDATMRLWCDRYSLGRKIAGTWHVSAVALRMFLDGDQDALELYLAGNRESPLVTDYFDRLGIPVPGRTAAVARNV